MMIHLETLMIWSLTAMTAREAGAHVFARERQNFPPSGEMAPPFGLAPHGSGSAPLRGTFGSTCSAPQKTKASLTTFAHTKAFVMSVCSHALAQKTKTTKDKALHKGVLYGVTPTCTAPFGASAMGLTLHRALKQRVPCTKACFMIEHAHCVRTKAFVVRLARWRLHKGVFYGNTSCLCSQCVWH